MRRLSGFTLIELLITVAIVAILTSLMAPGFSSFIKDNRLSGQINTLIGTIHLSRGEAANRRAIVTLCASDNGANCNSTHWEDGWILFSDANNDGNAIKDGTDQLLRYQEPLVGGNTLRATGFSGSNLGVLQFSSTGFILASSPSPGTLTLCDDRGARFAKAIVVNVSGVSRLAVDEGSSLNGILNDHRGSTGDLSCP
ncbi:MAG: type IV fimbrial biogenesis protein FimT [Motiliproteus sp.]|jgi:type IV fimbrial biogenesis protein FimT